MISKVYSIEVSKEEYITYSTEESEKMRLFDKFNKTKDMPTAIKLVASELREEALAKR